MARAIVKRNDGEVGDVIASFLSESDFQSLKHAGWVLADGRSVVGSKYETQTTNTTVPDLRGQFLRGKNNGRVDGSENPDGDLALGSNQADSLLDHKHALPFAVSGTELRTDINAPFGGEGAFTSDTNDTLTSGNAGDTYDLSNNIATSGRSGETRPKNVTINYFIKINEE